MTDGLLRRCGHGNASSREEMQAGKRKIPLIVAVAMVVTNYLPRQVFDAYLPQSTQLGN